MSDPQTYLQFSWHPILFPFVLFISPPWRTALSMPLNFLTPSYSFLPESPQNSHSFWRCFIWRKILKLSLLIEKIFLDWESHASRTVHSNGRLGSRIMTLLAHQRWIQLAQHPCRHTVLSTSSSTEWRSLPYPSKVMMGAIYWMSVSPQN